jgi:uncharacterized protein (TIGR04255 family)
VFGVSNKQVPKYKNPPVTEVVLEVGFEPLQTMKIPHYGLYWENIKNDFPSCTHVPFLGNPVGIGEPETGGIPLPRVWLMHKNDDYLIQLQKNLFIFNWRKPKNIDYPGFKVIEPQFYEYLDRFEQFCSQNDLGDINPIHYELKYVDHFPITKGWSDIKDFFPDISWRNDKNRYLQDINAFQWIAEIPMKKKKYGSITILAYKGSTGPQHTPGYILETSVRGEVASQQSLKRETWFDEAHQALTKTFEDFTNPKAQKTLWKKTNA